MGRCKLWESCWSRGLLVPWEFFQVVLEMTHQVTALTNYPDLESERRRWTHSSTRLRPICSGIASIPRLLLIEIHP